MEDNSKFWRELKALVVFLASGAFVAVHKEFMDPTELFPDSDLAIKVHNWGHYGIGLLLQILFMLWLLRIVWNVLGKPICLRFSQWLLRFQWFRSLRQKNISKGGNKSNE